MAHPFLGANGKILEANGHYCLVHSSKWSDVIFEGAFFSFEFFLPIFEYDFYSILRTKIERISH